MIRNLRLLAALPFAAAADFNRYLCHLIAGFRTQRQRSSSSPASSVAGPTAGIPRESSTASLIRLPMASRSPRTWVSMIAAWFSRSGVHQTSDVPEIPLLTTGANPHMQLVRPRPPTRMAEDHLLNRLCRTAGAWRQWRRTT